MPRLAFASVIAMVLHMVDPCRGANCAQTVT